RLVSRKKAYPPWDDPYWRSGWLELRIFTSKRMFKTSTSTKTSGLRRFDFENRRLHVSFGHSHGTVEVPLRIFRLSFPAVAGRDEKSAGLTLKVTLRIKLFADAIKHDH